jgi:hypothetical protein
MLKKLVISAATAATLVLGAGIMTATPAQAGVHFGFGFGSGFGYGYPGYGYGFHHRRHFGPAPVRCWIQTVRFHHRWVNRRVCRPVYY